MLICITGMIGSGKTAVSQLLRSRGYACISADEVNAALIKDSAYLKILRKNFGEGVFDGQTLNKKAMSALIFADKDKRELLNKLSHPLITKIIKEEIAKIDGTVFVEIPLLMESGIADMFDRIWLVESSDGLRAERIAARDGITIMQARQKMMSQAEGELYNKSVATDFLSTEQGIDSLKIQLETLLKNTGI